MVGLSFITFTKNSADRIMGLLEHVKNIVDEIIVIDGYSNDDTISIAKSYGARIYQRKPWGYPDPDRMFALRQATHEWVLMLDDDERLCKRLKDGLRELIENINDNYVAIDVLRVNLSSKNQIILAPYYPDRVIKIFKKDNVIFTGRVHEGPKTFGQIYRLPDEYYVIHLPYGERSWLKKNVTYAYFQAMQYLCINCENLFRRYLLNLMPITVLPYYLYFLAALTIKKRPMNYLSITYAFRRVAYDSFLHTLLKLRGSRKKNIAKIISEIGFIRFLNLINSGDGNCA